METVYKVSAVLLCVMLAVIAVVTCYAFFDSGRVVSDSENRTLTDFPELSADSWFSGEFSTSLENYLDDHVLMRDQLISVSKALEKRMRRQTKIRIVDVTDSTQQGTKSEGHKKPTDKPTEKPTEKPEEKQHEDNSSAGESDADSVEIQEETQD